MLRSLPRNFQHALMQIRRAWREYLIVPPLEPILHPSTRRIRWLGLFTFAGNPLFCWVWGYWLVQPYESITLRILVSLLGLILILPYISRNPFSQSTGIIFTIVTWLQLPVFFSWMYLSNSGNAVWLASFSVMILIWYGVTDWRIATVGLALGGVVAWLLFIAIGPNVPPIGMEQLVINAVVMAFSFGTALTMGASSANVRQAALSFSTEKAKALSALSGSIAHEMRNPLSQIKYSLDCIGNSLPAPTATDLTHPVTSHTLHELYRNLAQGHIAIKRGFQVISMTLSEVSSQAIDRSHFDYVSAALATQKAVDEYGYETQDERKKITVQIVEDFIFKGDETLYIFILFNLIKNALYYFKLHPHATITIRIEEAKVFVKDTGPGMTEAVRAQLFQAFKTSGKAQGTGLGLAYCKRAMLAFGGHISCASVLGQYTEFTLQFVPLSAQELSAYRDSVLQRAKPFLSGKRLLLVDDDAQLRASTKQLLTVLDIDIEEAANGEQALQALQQQAYDLILMDINMPVLDGYTTTEHIRAGRVPQHQHIPILAYTSELPYMAEVKTQKVGMNGFVSKPCSQLELIKAVQQVLESAANHKATGPPAASTTPSEAATPAPLLVAPVATVLTGKTVLIADDEAINRQIVRSYVEHWGMQVVEAEHGMAVLTHLQEKMQARSGSNGSSGIDIILMDMHMPGLSGVQTTQAIRQHASGAYPDIPIIALTADYSESKKQQALAAGMNAFMTKPLERLLLQETLSQLLSVAGAAVPTVSPVAMPAQDAQEILLPNGPAASRALSWATAQPLLNIARLDEMRKFTPDLLVESVPIYLQRMRVLQERLAVGVATQEFEPVHEALHSLLGISGDCGALALHQFIRRRIYPEVDRGHWPAEPQWLETIDSLRAQSEVALLAYMDETMGDTFFNQAADLLYTTK